MPINTDIRQAVILALESQGADTLAVLSDGISELQGKLQGWTDKLAAGDATASEYIKAIRGIEAEIQRLRGAYDEAGNDFDKFSDLQKHLGEMEKKAQGEVKEAILDTAAARRHGTQAIADFIVKTRQQIQAENDLAQSSRDIAAAEEKEFERLQSLNEAIKNNVQNASMATRATNEQIQALKDMGIIQDQVTTKVAAGKGQFGGFATAAEEAADKSKKMGYGLMNVAYAIQDIPYGLGAVVNNVGLLGTSLGNALPKLNAATAAIGGVTGLSAVVMAAGVGFMVVYDNLDKVAALFSSKTPEMIGNIDKLKESLKTLEGKTYKTGVDYQDIRNAREELRRLQEDKDYYDRIAKQHSESQQQRSKAVTESIVEGGGAGDYTSGAANVARGYAAATDVTDSPQTRRFRARLDKQRKEGAGPTLIGETEANLRNSIATDRENHLRSAELLVGRAGEGQEAARGEIERAFEANKRAFTAVGVSPEFGEMLREGGKTGLENKRRVDLDSQEAERKGQESIRDVKARFKDLSKISKARVAKDREVDEAVASAGRIAEAIDREQIRNDKASGRRDERDEAAHLRDLAAHLRDLKRAGAGFQRVNKQTTDAWYGQQFQAMTGVNDLQARAAGKEIAGQVEKGIDPATAMREVLKKLLAQMARMHQITQEQEAMLLRLNGFAEEADAQIAQINAKMRQAGGAQKRGKNNRPSNMSTVFPG